MAKLSRRSYQRRRNRNSTLRLGLLPRGNHVPNILFPQHAIKAAHISADDIVQSLPQRSQLSFEHRVDFDLLGVRGKVSAIDAARQIVNFADQFRREAHSILPLPSELSLNQIILDVD